jgi:hypothetical protein
LLKFQDIHNCEALPKRTWKEEVKKEKGRKGRRKEGRLRMRRG